MEEIRFKEEFLEFADAEDNKRWNWNGYINIIFLQT